MIKAYVEKQRRQPTKVAKDPAAPERKVEIGGIWSETGEDHRDTLHGGRFLVDVRKRRAPLAAAAPGVN